MIVVVVVVTALLGFGLWRATQPSPIERYVADALAVMDKGLYAGTPAWEEVRRDTLRAAADYASIEDAYADLEIAAAVAGGPHSSFLTPEAAARDVERANEAASEARPRARQVTGAEVGMLRLPSFNTSSESAVGAYARTGIDEIARTSARCGWIVDLRGNTGGNLYPMLGAVLPLLAAGPVLHFEYLDGDRAAVEIRDSSILLDEEVMLELDTAIPAGYRGHVAVVYDRRTASAGEGVALAFAGQEGVRSFGEPTAGYSTANITTTLDDGALVIMTVAVMTATDGTSADGGRLLPDERTPTTGGTDPIGHATAWLTETCSSMS